MGNMENLKTNIQEVSAKSSIEKHRNQCPRARCRISIMENSKTSVQEVNAGWEQWKTPKTVSEREAQNRKNEKPENQHAKGKRRMGGIRKSPKPASKR